MAIYKDVLDEKLRAAQERKSGFIVRSFCHPKANMEVCYEDGALTLNCGECGTLVVKIAVAERGDK
jgi:hypothetical protein